MYEDESGRRNASGCADPTAARAMRRTESEREAVARMLAFRSGVHRLAKACGLHARVELRDKATGARL